jgi:hypothetical protein
MIFLDNQKIYAKVWKIQETQEKFTKLQVSTSEKGENNGEYKNSGWFITCIGHAKNSLKDVKESDTIIITRAKLTNEYNKEKKQSYFNFIVLEASIKGNTTTETPQKPVTKKNNSEEDPF